MPRNAYKLLVLLMWLALPASFFNYWRVWDQLPARMAVHFDANWEPNGYTSRKGALELGLGIMFVMLVLLSVTTLVIFAMKPAAAWPALVLSYVVVGFCWYGNYSIVNFNLNPHGASSQSSVLSSRCSKQALPTSGIRRKPRAES